MSQPIVLTNGQHEIKIYTVQNRGRAVFQLSYYEGGHRQRRTYGKLSDARREAKVVLGRLAVNTHEAEELSTADMESYVIARKHIASTGLPLHVCAELFAQAQTKLGGRPLLDAVEFFMDYHPNDVLAKPLIDVINDFAERRQAMGVRDAYVTNIRRQLGRLAAANPGRSLTQLRTAEIDRWLGSQAWHPVTKNNVRNILITFGNWAKANRHLPANRPTEFDGLMSYKEPPTKVEIYTPAELGTLFAAVEARRPELLPWLACAAYTGARVSEIDHLAWEHINFERNFVEIESSKVRTKARRLVPLHEALKSRLQPYRRDLGPINVYFNPQAALKCIASRAGMELKANGFRHSYISYRLAAIHDTARVALEAGNSPQVIFQHYRELVTPEDAARWFAVVLPKITKPENVIAKKSA